MYGGRTAAMAAAGTWCGMSDLSDEMTHAMWLVFAAAQRLRDFETMEFSEYAWKWVEEGQSIPLPGHEVDLARDVFDAVAEVEALL